LIWVHVIGHAAVGKIRERVPKRGQLPIQHCQHFRSRGREYQVVQSRNRVEGEGREGGRHEGERERERGEGERGRERGEGERGGRRGKGGGGRERVREGEGESEGGAADK